MSILFELERMERLTADIERLRYPISIPVSQYKMYEGKLKGGESCDVSGWQDYQIETPWTKLDAHRWLRTTIVIPEEMDQKHVVNSPSTDFRKRRTMGCNESTDAVLY